MRVAQFVATGFGEFARHVGDSLFPIFCFGCGREGVWLCTECQFRVETEYRVFTGGTSAFVSSVVVCGQYREHHLLARIIHAVKYAHADAALQTLEPLVKEAVVRAGSFFSIIDTIMPIPLHPRRFAERGFNQAALIAEMLSRFTGLPVLHGLERHRYTKQQTRLTKTKRKENIRGAFRLSASAAIRGKRILLVDDVYTTGATIEEAARVLMLSGATTVSGLVLARG